MTVVIMQLQVAQFKFTLNLIWQQALSVQIMVLPCKYI